MLTVHEPGTVVDLGEDLQGLINQVNIAGKDHVTYQVVWWVGNERKCEWLDDHELALPKEPKLKIGFGRRARNADGCV